MREVTPAIAEANDLNASEDLFCFLVTGSAPGNTVELTIPGDDQRQTVTVSRGKRPPSEAS